MQHDFYDADDKLMKQTRGGPELFFFCKGGGWEIDVKHRCDVEKFAVGPPGPVVRCFHQNPAEFPPDPAEFPGSCNSIAELWDEVSYPQNLAVFSGVNKVHPSTRRLFWPRPPEKSP